MIILLADKLSETGIDALRAAGHDVHDRPELNGNALVEALAEINPTVLVVRSTKVPEPALKAASGLELVVRAGAGYDTIDVASASRLGIFIANCPGKNAIAVAELTMGLILSLDRRIPDNVSDARAGIWNKKGYAKAAGIKGRTLGLVGLGNIGKAVARRAQAFGMNVIAWSRSLTPEAAADLGVGYRESPLAVAAEADVVSLHVASKPDTQGLANRVFFEAMKEGAFFLNTTRAAVVNDDALLWAVDQKGIRAGLDVFGEEPAVKEGEFKSRVAAHPSIYVTHHIGASTAQAQEAIAAEAVRVVSLYGDTGEVANCVNMAEKTPATHQLTVRHGDRVGVLASVLDVMREAQWNIQEMENLVFEGAEAACAYIRFDGSASDEAVARIAGLEHVLAVSIIDL